MISGTDYEILLKLRADIAQAVGQLNSVQSELRKTSDSAVSAGGGMNKMGAETGALMNKLKTLPGLTSKIQVGFHDLRNIIVGAFAIHEIANFTGSLVNANVEAQKIHYTLQQAFGAEGAKQQFQFVIDISKKLGLSLEDAAQGYAKLAASAQGTGLQTKDLQKLFVGLSQAATVFHLSGDDVNGTLTQLSQGLSLGTLHMQDLRAIAQHLPGTMVSITAAVNKMGFSMEDALKKGIPAVQLIGNLGEVLQQRYEKQAEEASHSLNGEIQRLKTTLFEATTQGNDFASAMAGAIGSLNDTLDDASVREGFESIITALGKIAALAIKAGGEMSKFFSEIGQGLGITIARFEAGGIDPGDQLGVAKKNLQDINTEIQRLQSFGTTDHGVNVGASDDVIRRILGTDYGTSITPAMVKQAIAQRQLQAKNLRDAIARLQSGDTGGPIVASKGTQALAPILGGSPKAPGPDAAAIKAAAKTARDAAAAQKELTQSLIALQGQLSPTAAIWAKYNEQVAKADSEAALAKKAKGADAAAIDAQRNAVVGLAATIRDAALDQLAEKDRQAWEALKRSFETPAEVRVDDALKQIAQLNQMLKEGVINAQQYHDALGQIGQKTVADTAPTYQGLDATVGGPYGELQKNYQAEVDLNAWRNAQIAAGNKKFNDADAAQHEAHHAQLAGIEKIYAQKRVAIDRSRGTLQLDAASSLFGQLATLSTSHNKKMAAIGKAAAIAQAVIETYKSANEAYSAMALIPYVGPELGIAAAAAAVAAGLANVAAIRSQSVGGYSAGGLVHGPGTSTSDSVPARLSAGEVVVRESAVRYYGADTLLAMNDMRVPRFAAGGFVAPFANAPSPADLGFALRPAPNVRMPAPSGNASVVAQPQPVPKVLVYFDKEAVMDELANTTRFEKATVHVVGTNPRTIQGRWQSG